MEILVIADDEYLLCEKHSAKVTMLIIDNLKPFQETLLCPECFESRNNSYTRFISLVDAEKIIAEKYSENDEKDFEQKQQFLEELKQFVTSILEFKNKIILQIDIILNITNKWTTDLFESLDQKSQKSLFQKLKELHENNFLQNEKRKSMEQIKQVNVIALQTSFTKLCNQDELSKCNQRLKSILGHIQSYDQELKIRKRLNNQQTYLKGLQEDISNVPKQWMHVNTIQQIQECHAIAFNNEGNLMAASCEKNIIVWQFEKGKLFELKTLIGHSQSIQCLVFSTKTNWLASGSEDKTIRSWKEQDNNWISSQPQQQHTKYINCLLLSNNENELISCSGDRTIKIWKVDCQINMLKYDYSLEIIHKGVVNCISLNLSQNALVSCSCDDTIILWMKGKNKKWEYINHITTNTGFRICFVSDTQILFQPLHDNETHIFEIENEQLIDKPNLIINLLLATDDNGLFPSIYNQKKQMIIQKQNNFVYIIQKQVDGSFKIVLEPIDCFSLCNFGSLTNDGEYLVIWNFLTKEFRVYQILY